MSGVIKDMGELDITSLQLKIGPRYVKQENGLRPFQKETVEAIKDPDVKLITVEAPVGSGKSYIIRNLVTDSHFDGTPIVLTYPTKILMDAQVESIKKEMDNVAVWPDDANKFPLTGKSSINVWKYSLDSLSTYMKERPEEFDAFANRGELLSKGMFSIEYGEKKIFVTTPDVLWLIYSGKYKGCRMLQSQLNGALVSFDEFHAYSELWNFYNLLENLIFKSKVSKVVLLSATPFVRREGWKKIEKYLEEKRIKTTKIPFKNSESDEHGKIFNYPLNVRIFNFKYVDWTRSFPKILKILKNIETPAAIIFDSIFRLKHFKMFLKKNNLSQDIKFREWSGMIKDKEIPNLIKNQENVVVLGTSAIEVGIDMKFRSLITEAANWTSAIQRIGRVGRMSYLDDPNPKKNPGNIYLFIDSRDTYNKFNGKTSLARNEFEVMLQETLKSPSGLMVDGELLRGENFTFVLVDSHISKPIIYSESIFSMYDIDESDCFALYGSEREKKEILQYNGVLDKYIDKIIIRDKLVGVWGVVKSDKLKKKYEKIIDVEKEPDDNPKRIRVITETNNTGFSFSKEKVSDDMDFEIW